MLKKKFKELIGSYTNDNSLINELWNEIERNYSAKKRHYHNLTHLENMLKELDEVVVKIHHPEAILFSLFYHDIIYNPSTNNNEEKSAESAARRMKELSVPDADIKRTEEQILATKSHHSLENDTQYLIDADLSILGQTQEVYSIYSQNVRKEFSIYPDFIYKSGRRKVLKDFLERERIFKTDYFYQKYEKAARINIENELREI
ncbi:hypothetical protein [Moheibacter sp.]|uniref:HD domain-containing protein n=1 Tax=Moheibacter sp. TaxID=1965316 RepID=UPI003C74F0EB